MRTTIYAGTYCIYDSAGNLGDSSAQALTVVLTVNEAGTAEITLPYNHPDVLYNSSIFVPLKTETRIFNDNEEEEPLFRGRLLSIRDSLYGSKTFVCEGELAFLKDSVVRPQTFSGTLYQIFSGILSVHNGQVDQWRQFLAGTVDVTTDDSSPSIAVTEATPTATVFAQLLSEYGGYISFSTDEETGYRVIEWHAAASAASSQPVKLGLNLMDYSSDLAISEYANRIIPYGKRVDDARVTISDNGHDYVEDTASQAIYGVITKAVIFDDIDSASKLKKRARAYLAQAVLINKTVSISAVDLSGLFATPQMSQEAYESWRVGQLIHVLIEPRNVDAYYMLTQRHYDLLDPSKDTITLGSKPVLLTGEMH